MSAVVCTALLIGACGGGDDDSADDPIPGADQSATENDGEDNTDTEAPEEDTADDDTDSDRPEIDLGDDFENIYEDDETGDETTDAILRDSRGYFDAVDAAIIHQDTEHPALSYYITGDALVASVDLVSTIVGKGESASGTARIFNRSVEVFDEETAAVSFCRDFSEVDDIDHDSGDIATPADPSAKPTLYVTRVELNDVGVWQTIEYRGERGASECN
ncbi:hypothetical protein [Streptomyces lonarensis]|uniref:Uncharacterized protein n=1 Tax=Streptomyces lonarensis TaxID=700599 RepID=A0A7X6D0A7_9ACTN|nr:hypothetical protein [Streptomyces lonarensis]NJQ05797.1 hypothetical protein [Streptomyces lonarensis]